MATPQTITDDDLSKLSPEERAAIEDDTEEQELDAVIGDDDDQDDDQDDNSEGDGDDDDADADDDQDQAQDDDGDDAGAGDESADGAGQDAGDGEQQDQASAAAGDDKTQQEDAPDGLQQLLPVNLVEDFDAKIAAFKDQKAALRQKLEDGDLDIAEYEEQREAIVDQENSLKTQQALALNNANANRSMAEQKWIWEQEQFLAQPQNEIYSKDKYLALVLNQVVIDLANDPNNEAWSGPKILIEADKIIRTRFGLGKPEPVKQEQAEADAKGKKVAVRKPDLSKVPKTLREIPKAETEETGGGEFAHLDDLTGMELERALAKLTPDQERRYLQG